MAKQRISAEEKRWQAEEDLRIIRRAEEIKSNAQRMAAAKRIAKQESDALRKIAAVRPSKKR